MPPRPAPARLQPLETTAAILLTLAAGYIDAIGFLRLDGIYVANMSGNSVAIGLHSALRDWPTVLERTLPVVCYVGALIAARMLVNLAGILQFQRVVAASLAIEILFLVLFMRSAALNSGIILAAIAMGIQAATVSKFNGVTVYTAFVTGSLVRFAETFSEWLIGLAGNNRSASDQAGKDAIWFLGVWCAYVGGALAGALLHRAAGPRVVVFVCALLFILTVTDLIHPMRFDAQT